MAIFSILRMCERHHPHALWIATAHGIRLAMTGILIKNTIPSSLCWAISQKKPVPPTCLFRRLKQRASPRHRRRASQNLCQPLSFCHCRLRWNPEANQLFSSFQRKLESRYPPATWFDLTGCRIKPGMTEHGDLNGCRITSGMTPCCHSSESWNPGIRQRHGLI